MSHPRRADAFREWSKMMLEQAIVPDRLQYKGASASSSTKSYQGKKTSRRGRRKRFRVRKRQQQE